MKTSNLSNYGIAMNPSLPRGKPSGPVALASLLMVSLVCAGQTPSVTTRSAAASANEFQRGDSLEIRDGQLVWNAPGKSDTNRNSVATLKNVVDLLREQHPEANFILSPGLDRVSIADLKLRNADVKEKLQAICIASGSIVGWRDENQSPGGRIDPVTGVALPEERRASQPMFVFYDTGALSARPALQVEAFNISAYLESVMAGVADPDERSERANRAIAEIHQMAVETVDRYRIIRSELTGEKSNSLKMPSIDFHRGANLCIIIGEPEAVSVAGKVVGALPGAQRSVAAEPIDVLSGGGALGAGGFGGGGPGGGGYGLDPRFGRPPR